MSDDLHCKTCKHFHPLPRVKTAGPAALNGAVDMSVPAMGHCRARPPEQLVMGQDDKGNLMMSKPFYKLLPEDTKVCGLHEAAAVLSDVQ